MEALNFNETNINDKSHLNSSVDLSYWKSLSVNQVPQQDYCYFIYQLQFQNLTLQLYPWAELKELSSLCNSRKAIQRVVFGLPLAIGIPGNILALLTILRFPRTPGTFYLTLLAIFDWLALVTKATNTLIVSTKIHESISCKLVMMLSNFTGTYANWILVLICFERFITVLFPLKKNYYFTMRRARLGAIILAVVIFLFCSVFLWKITADGESCVEVDKGFMNTFNHFSSLFYSYLPSILLIIMVLMIWRELKKIQKIREYIFCGEEGSSTVALTQQRLQEQAKTERSITMMLLFAAVIFVLMTVPMCVALAIESSGFVRQSISSKLYFDLFITVARGLVILTHAVNFFIYFLSTERFRRNFRQLFRCLPNDRKLSCNEMKTVHTIEDQL